MMITTKLLQTGQKQLLKKPERIKIKHKTYRELLGLDRPKKKISIESQNQNDDFLEKLLKEEQKQKKKKQNLKKTQNKKKSQKKTSRQKTSTNQVNKDNSNNNVIKIQKSSQILTAPQPKIQIQKEIPEIDRILMQNQRKKSAKSYRSNMQNKKSVQNIKVDDGNEVPYIVNNFLLNSLATIRSSKGFQALGQSHHQRKSHPSLNININHKLNPQAHAVVHEFSSQTKYKKFKANRLSINQLMSMTGRLNLNEQVKRERKNRQKLFQRQQDEDIFVQSLRSIKQRRFQRPIPSII